MKIKSFRGKLDSGGEVRLRLATKKGEIGYKIHKFQLMVTEPGEQSSEHTCQIFSYPQDPVSNTVDFSNSELLAVAWLGFGATTGPTNTLISIFDNVAINQDIYVTASDVGGFIKPINYYIELEQIKLDLNEATIATLKDMRGRE